LTTTRFLECQHRSVDQILLIGCIMYGRIDSQSILVQGTPDLVRPKTLEVLDTMMSGGGRYGGRPWPHR